MTVCIVSWFTTAMTMATEIIHINDEVQGLQARQTAFAQGTLPAFDAQFVVCPFFVPGTDVVNQPAGYGLTTGWHTINAMLSFFLFLEEFPKVHFFVERMDAWAGGIIGKDVGTWQTGALQMMIAMSILGVSDGVEGTIRTAWFRFITAWLLAAISVCNIWMGMVYGKDVRKFRGQIKPDHDKGEKTNIQKVKDAWVKLDAVVGTIQAGVSIGAYLNTREALDEAVKELEDD